MVGTSAIEKTRRNLRRSSKVWLKIKNPKAPGSHAGGGRDVLKASRSKERPRLAGRDPSLRLPVLPVGGEDLPRRSAFRLSATQVCNKTVRRSARWLTHWQFQMANATFVSHGSDGAIDQTFSLFPCLARGYGHGPARIGGLPTRDYPAGVRRRFARPTSTVSFLGYERFLSAHSRRHLPG